ncbi:hypothetical protein ABFY60_09125 [Lysinibacillus pakistanensis]
MERRDKFHVQWQVICAKDSNSNNESASLSILFRTEVIEATILFIA